MFNLFANPGSTISIHALLAESDSPPDFCYLDNIISIHALLAESDRRNSTERPVASHFYPRSPCGERPSRKYPVILGNEISIHALLAESDIISIVLLLPQIRFLSTLSLRRATIDSSRAANCQQHFYPRSPCGERPRGEHHANSRQEFLSTLSLRRATHQACSGNQRPPDFYPRSPCGERPLRQL